MVMSRIVIAGGGIAGLAAALAVARAGRAALVLEQATHFTELGAGIQIGPNGRRALEMLGVWRWLRPHVHFPDAIRVLRARGGREIARIALGDSFRRRFGGTYQVVHRADLLGALLAAVAEHADIELRTAARVEAFEETPTEVVARLADGGLARGEALIGADGIHSRVRAQLLGAQPLRMCGHVLYRALVPLERVRAPREELRDVCLWLRAGGHVVHYPVKGGMALNIVAAVDERWTCDMNWGEPTAGQRVRVVFADAPRLLAAVLQAPRRWMRWAGADRAPVARWGRGRITLLGDAAHPTLPYLASGAVMALEDAAVLMRHLAQEADVRAAFRAMERERVPRTRRIVESSWRLARVYHAAGPLALGRDLFLRAQSLAGGGQERMAWLYGWQP